MLTFTFAVDEAGDAGFAFGKGASRYFVMAVIATGEADSLRALLHDVRDKSGLPAMYEFGFHALTSSSLRRRVFETLSQANFEAWALVVDKTMLGDSFKLMSGLDFYLYFVTELIRQIPLAKRDGGTLILDEFGSAPQVKAQLRRFLTVRGIPRQFRHVQIKRSKSEPLIQIADLVAGAILRRDAKNDAAAFEHIARKVKHILELP